MISEKEKARKLEKIRVAFLCRHHNLASECSQCKRKDWRDSVTASGEGLGLVAERLIASGEIGRVEVEEFLNEGKKKRRIKGLATFAGVIIASFLVYEGGKITLRLFFSRKESPKQK